MKIPLCLYAAVHASFMAGHYCDYDGMQSVSGCGENHRLIRGIHVSANAERRYSSVCDAYAFCVSCPARKRFHCSFYRHSRSQSAECGIIRFPGSRSLSVDCLIPAAHRQSFAVRSIFRARRTHYFARIRIRHMRQYNKISKGRHHLKKKLPASIHGNLIEIRK